MPLFRDIDDDGIELIPVGRNRRCSVRLASSGPVPGQLARKIGLINTTVFTHMPSSAAVLFFPFPPYLWLTAGLLLRHTGLNDIDQAPRSAFIAAVVPRTPIRTGSPARRPQVRTGLTTVVHRRPV
ncbi:hypothetical protein AYL99_11592 [Fonsecaea erecta]|uniref:Uncharacterized protein n=1 Tax=Fonsecaea erecta TaxID=1367422 RepID=A0A178Z2M0_9EURO|nr:hypothetical protein AYL99_11592 [Fonsecaea erecta]OAP54058.1 hypothetical protein AYL99_11592 [Fonsecaea erecta]